MRESDVDRIEALMFLRTARWCSSRLERILSTFWARSRTGAGVAGGVRA